ncbi:MAG: hypothetical protein M1827_002424 [Pycnora praestabilis]|nr:MAG: hypothetical protein M1827_002424 [Pycnora praestabilis]
MPLYDVEYCFNLTRGQKDHLAASITKIHTRMFVTPSLFVNVRFIDCSDQELYIAGKPQVTNRIFAHIRSGGDRSTSQFNTLCTEIASAWDSIFDSKNVNEDRPVASEGHTKLRAVFVLPVIGAGLENGFALPPAGGDKEWVRKNMSAFEKLADEGNEDFKDVVEEIRKRDEFRNLVEGTREMS